MSQKRGRDAFSKREFGEIIALVEKLRRFADSRSPEPRSIRKQLRDEYGLFISDFSRSKDGFSVADLHAAVRQGTIQILP